jgi:hypothetical protein
VTLVEPAKSPAVLSTEQRLRIGNTVAEKVRVEHPFSELLVYADVINLDNTKGVTVKLRLAAKQDANFRIDDEFVQVGASTEHVECGIESVRLDDSGHCGDTKSRPRQKTRPTIDPHMQRCNVTCWVDEALGWAEAMAAIQRSVIHPEAER